MVSLIKIEGQIILSVEVAPTAFMLELTEKQARKLATSLMEMADSKAGGVDDSLAELLAGKNPGEVQ